jgi:sigma-E factor negative regulatory protein RseB
MQRSSAMKRGDNLRLLHLALALTLGSIWSDAALAAERAPREQLARMSDALRSLSYEGILVYLHDNKLETLRVVHRVEEGQIREQLVSLNGPVRTLTREKGKVTCELSNSHPISVPGHGLKHDLLHARAIDPGAFADHYLIHPLGSARVAGRQADVVGIVPGDELRYGYRFYLDRESGLPLKSDLMGQDSDPIEQIMFTFLRLEAESKPFPAVVVPALEPRQEDAAVRAPDSVPWKFVELPAGFTLVMQDSWRDTSGQSVVHFVLSDGLASVSVYVESDPQEGLEGATRIGAVHAAGSRVSGHQVTVVGEVPSVTVQAVLAGIRYQEGGRP